MDLFLRKSPDRDQPANGVKLEGPEFKILTLAASYVSEGEKAWRVSATNNKLWDDSRVVAGLSLSVSGLRPKGDEPIEDTLLVAAAPQVQLYPWGEKHLPVAVA